MSGRWTSIPPTVPAGAPRQGTRGWMVAGLCVVGAALAYKYLIDVEDAPQLAPRSADTPGQGT